MDDEAKIEKCGIIMPISGNESHSAEHWIEVLAILEEVISKAGFEPRLVSDADEIGIIHNRIVTNIAENPIIVCDVSSKNPNVMFELGLRLAFDRATIIIQDDHSVYNFDTSPIEHLKYPKDLRYGAINKFKIKLQEKIKSTYEASKDKGYSTFLKSFIQYKPKLEKKDVPFEEYILKQLENLSKHVYDIKKIYSMSETQIERLKYKPTVEAIESSFVDYVRKSKFTTLKQLNKEEYLLQFMKDILNKQTNLFADVTANEALSIVSPIYDILYKRFVSGKENKEEDSIKD